VAETLAKEIREAAIVAAAVFAVIHSRAPTGISPSAPEEEFFFRKKIAWDPLAPGTQ
jgi:hypothetical protein